MEARMSNDETRRGPGRPGADSPALRGDDEISVAQVLDTLKRRRRILGLIWAAAAAACLVAVVAAYFLYPRHTTAQLGFRLLFEGADRGKYPNGTPFSPSEITALPILERVYRENGLDQYGTLEQFKSSLVVLQTSRSLEQLEAEYNAKLAEPRLLAAERQVLEREFAERLESLNNSEFRLTFMLDRGLREMPRSLASKVIAEIVSGYAEYADRYKGALKYRVAVPSRNVIPPGLAEDGDYVVSLDMLRGIVATLQESITELKEVPNALTIRVGASGMGLADLEARLIGLRRAELGPMIEFARVIRASRNTALTIQYLRSQQFAVRLDREAASRKAGVYLESLRTYVAAQPGSSSGPGQTPIGGRSPGDAAGNMPALIPQLGDSFFNRLMELGTKGDDASYRQNLVNQGTDVSLTTIELEKEEAYYDSLIRSFESGSGSPAAQRQQFDELFRARYPEIFKTVLQAIDDVNLFYDELSRSNLNPVTLLVEMTEPVTVRTEASLSFRRVALAVLLYFCFVGLGSIVGILLHARLGKGAVSSR